MNSARTPAAARTPRTARTPRQTRTAQQTKRSNVDAMELSEIIKAAPDYDTRRAWANANSATIAALLESPSKTEVPQRIWRMRYFQDGEYLVATLVQNVNLQAAPGQIVPRVVTYLARGYHHTTTGGSVATQSLGEGFSTDEITAFLRLDLVDPDTVAWHDETRYSVIARPTGDLVRSMLRARND